jgi:hypothetical protein
MEHPFGNRCEFYKDGERSTDDSESAVNSLVRSTGESSVMEDVRFLASVVFRNYYGQYVADNEQIDAKITAQRYVT